MTLQATGVGSESGDRYRLAETQNTVVNDRPTSANENIVQIHGTLIRQGSEGENAIVEIQFRLITNANGEVTANVDNIDVRCVG